MYRRFAAVVVVASLAITGCASMQPSASVAVPAEASAPPSVAPSIETPDPASSPPSPAPSGAASIHDGPLAAGHYAIDLWDDCGGPPMPGCSPSPDHDAIRLTFAIPEGWSGVGDDSILLADKGNAAPDGAGLLLGRGAWLRSDPCRSPNADVEVGPSVDDFANALADHPLLEVTDPVDVTLAGYTGKYVDLQVPADLSGCEIYFPFEPGMFAQGPGHQWHLWILDVDGLRFVVQSTDYPGTSAEDRSALAAIVESIDIEP